jgi:hypothetical protein
VQAAERDEAAARSVQIGQPVGAIGVGDVDLDDNQVRDIVECQRLDMLVLDDRAIVRIEIGGERGKAERRKQRVLDRPEERTGRLGQRRQDELDAQRSGLYFAL